MSQTRHNFLNIRNILKRRAYTYKEKYKGGNVDMEYAKNEFFQVSYHTNLNRLEMKGESWTSKLWRKVKKHKLLTTTIVAFFAFAILNVVMIYSFMRILQSI